MSLLDAGILKAKGFTQGLCFANLLLPTCVGGREGRGGVSGHSYSQPKILRLSHIPPPIKYSRDKYREIGLLEVHSSFYPMHRESAYTQGIMDDYKNCNIQPQL